MQIGKLTDSVLQWYTGEHNFSDAFLGKVLSSTMHDRRPLVNSIFGALIPSISLFSKSISHIVDFFLQDEQADGNTVGLDLESGEPFDPTVEGIWDNYRVKRQMLHSWCVQCSSVFPVRY